MKFYETLQEALNVATAWQHKLKLTLCVVRNPNGTYTVENTELTKPEDLIVAQLKVFLYADYMNQMYG